MQLDNKSEQHDLQLKSMQRSGEHTELTMNLFQKENKIEGKRFVCPTCNAIFPDKRQLEVHDRRRHQGRALQARQKF